MKFIQGDTKLILGWRRGQDYLKAEVFLIIKIFLLELARSGPQKFKTLPWAYFVLWSKGGMLKTYMPYAEMTAHKHRRPQYKLLVGVLKHKLLTSAFAIFDVSSLKQNTPVWLLSTFSTLYNVLGREPWCSWCSCYGRRLMFKRMWVQFPALWENLYCLFSRDPKDTAMNVSLR